MRSVRCEVCGTKALMAASQCPKCSHPFAVRNGFGELLPLAHCSTCDSDYPLTVGECKWCGTPPERAPIAPFVWKGVGILAFVAMALGAWLIRDDPPADVSAARLRAVLKPDSSLLRADSIARLARGETLASVDSADTTTQVISTGVVSADTTLVDASRDVASTDTTARPATTSVVVADTVSLQSGRVIAQAEPAVAVDPAPIAPAIRTPVRTPARPPARVARRVASSSKAPAAKPPAAKRSTVKPSGSKLAAAKPSAARPSGAKVAASKPTARPRSSGRWVSSVARNWVIVRADPSRQSRIIASIGPSTRVQLGESRGAWRRIRAKGFAGWVEHRSFFARSGAPAKAGRLAAR